MSFVPPSMGVGRHDVTVIVPTKNEAENIVRFLDSIPADIEVIAIDSSDDGTANIIETHRPEHTMVIRAKANIPVARQIGGDAAVTPWLLYTDADVTFTPGYFDRLSEVPLPRRCGGVVGAKSTVDGFDLYHRWFVRGQAALMAVGIPAATGSNMLVLAEALRSAGGFDRKLSVNEDTELMFRLDKAGWPIAFRPDLIVHAFDHRRLEAGLVRKVAHGAVRNAALYLGWFEHRVRRSDWGYWSEPRIEPSTSAR